jgi:hypothetical protein
MVKLSGSDPVDAVIVGSLTVIEVHGFASVWAQPVGPYVAFATPAGMSRANVPTLTFAVAVPALVNAA